MQQLWKQHAARMDAQGKAFAQSVYGMHSQSIKVPSHALPMRLRESNT